MAVAVEWQWRWSGCQVAAVARAVVNWVAMVAVLKMAVSAMVVASAVAVAVAVAGGCDNCGGSGGEDCGDNRGGGGRLIFILCGPKSIKNIASWY